MKTPDLSRLLGDDAGRPARRAEDDPVPDRAVRQPGVALALVRLGRPRRRSRRRASTSRRWSTATRKELVWTSGATESINLALKGAAHFYKDKGKHLVTVQTEHKATLDTMRELEREGFEVTYLDVKTTACSTSRRSRRRCGPDTIVVSVMFVNNEIGVIQDIAGDRRDLPRARHHLPRRRRAGDRQGADRPRDAEGRPDVVLGAQDLRPEGHRRAVRAAQAARAHRGADARRRPRARHALGHAADAPDRRHGRGVPHREGWRWRPRTSASACCATGCGRACREIEEVYVNGDMERRVPHNLNVELQLRRGRVR